MSPVHTHHTNTLPQSVLQISRPLQHVAVKLCLLLALPLHTSMPATYQHAGKPALPAFWSEFGGCAHEPLERAPLAMLRTMRNCLSVSGQLRNTAMQSISVGAPEFLALLFAARISRQTLLLHRCCVHVDHRAIAECA